MRSPSRPRFDCLERWDMSCRFLPSLVRLRSLRSRKNRNLRHLRGRYQRHNRNRWCMVSCLQEISPSDSLWVRSGQGLQTSEMRVLNGRGDERTGTKAWNSLYDVSIHKQCLRFPNAPRLRITLGEYPELGVDKRSGSDRVSKSFLYWDRDIHRWGCGVCDARIFGSLITRGSGEAGFLWR